MLYITYWELNTDKDIRELARVMAKLQQEGKWPPPGTEILAFYITPSVPMWGVTIGKTDNEENLYKSIMALIKAVPGYMKSYKVSPVQEVKDVIGLALE